LGVWLCNSNDGTAGTASPNINFDGYTCGDKYEKLLMINT
jgi:hypothetical protein